MPENIIWIDILWEAEDGLPIDHPDHTWGVTGCMPEDYRACIAWHAEDAEVSAFPCTQETMHVSLRRVLDALGRSL